MQDLRTVAPDEFERWLRAESRAHGNRLAHDPEELRPHFDLDRTVAVFEGDNIIGGSNSHLVEMSIPGATSIVAGVSNVAVQPTHTRQGLMTRMVRHQFDDFHERGEPLSGLFASESSIYGRFGYGIGSVHERWSIDRRYNAYARYFETPGRMVFVEPADITKELPDVFRRSTLDRPGVFQRAPHHWEQASRDPDHEQGGRGGLFYIAYEYGGKIEGYATYRTGNGALTVNELMATTKESTAALWRFCFDVDLHGTTNALKRPVDDPLPWMLADPRKLERTTRDGLWLRIIDVPGALELRRYMESGRLRFEVMDDFCRWNEDRFELEASTEEATCRPTTASADLSIAVSALASTYLGTVSFSALAGTGLVEEKTPGALLRADRMFAVQYQPWTPYNF